MREIDMSAEAVTARLKLVSQLRRFCLSLSTAKIESKPAAGKEYANKSKPARQTRSK